MIDTFAYPSSNKLPVGLLLDSPQKTGTFRYTKNNAVSLGYLTIGSTLLTLLLAEALGAVDVLFKGVGKYAGDLFEAPDDSVEAIYNLGIVLHEALFVFDIMSAPIPPTPVPPGPGPGPSPGPGPGPGPSPAPKPPIKVEAHGPTVFVKIDPFTSQPTRAIPGGFVFRGFSGWVAGGDYIVKGWNGTPIFDGVRLRDGTQWGHGRGRALHNDFLTLDDQVTIFWDRFNIIPTFPNRLITSGFEGGEGEAFHDPNTATWSSVTWDSRGGVLDDPPNVKTDYVRSGRYSFELIGIASINEFHAGAGKGFSPELWQVTPTPPYPREEDFPITFSSRCYIYFVEFSGPDLTGLGSRGCGGMMGFITRRIPHISVADPFPLYLDFCLGLNGKVKLGYTSWIEPGGEDHYWSPTGGTMEINTGKWYRITLEMTIYFNGAYKQSVKCYLEDSLYPLDTMTRTGTGYQVTQPIMNFVVGKVMIIGVPCAFNVRLDDLAVSLGPPPPPARVATYWPSAEIGPGEWTRFDGHSLDVFWRPKPYTLRDDMPHSNAFGNSGALVNAGDKQDRFSLRGLRIGSGAGAPIAPRMIDIYMYGAGANPLADNDVRPILYNQNGIPVYGPLRETTNSKPTVWNHWALDIQHVPMPMSFMSVGYRSHGTGALQRTVNTYLVHAEYLGPNVIPWDCGELFNLTSNVTVDRTRRAVLSESLTLVDSATGVLTLGP